MDMKENLGDFIKENSRLVKDWVETKMEMYRLMAIRIIAKSGGYIMWTIVSLFLVFLLVIFLGLTLGFWLSELTGSYTTGFGLVSIILLLLILIITAFRKKLFIDPVIRTLVDRNYSKVDHQSKPGNHEK